MSDNIKKLKEIYHWLDNDKYDDVMSQIDLYDWMEIVLQRLEALDDLENEPIKKTKNLLSIVNEIEDNSILKIRCDGFRKRDLFYTPVLKTLNYIDLHERAINYPVPLLATQKKETKYLAIDETLQKYKEWIYTNKSNSIYSFIGEEPRYHYQDSSIVFFEVDTSATDEIILNSMKMELLKIREKTKFTSFKKNITDNDLIRYKKMRILQYIDIIIFSKFHDIKIPSYKNMAILLYPEELYDDVDIIERVRRTTRELAHEVFDGTYFCSLCSQLEFDRQYMST